jgi:hypothetical protein
MMLLLLLLLLLLLMLQRQGALLHDGRGRRVVRVCVGDDRSTD